MQYVLYGVLGLGLLLLAVAAWQAGMRAQQVAFNLTRPEPSAETATPDDFGLADWEEVSFESGEFTLTAWFVPPTTADGATMVLVPGWTGNRSTVLAEAAVLHEAGYGALLLNVRNHGTSDGRYTTWGLHEADDVVAAVDYLQTREDVDPVRIGALGKSMGGAAVLGAAAADPDIQAVVSMSTYSSLEGNLPSIVQNIGGLPETFTGLVLRFMERETGHFLTEVNGVDDVAAIAPRPILFMHGANDQLVDPAQAEELFEAASEPKELVLVPGAAHIDVLQTDPDLFAESVVGFLDEYLRP